MLDCHIHSTVPQTNSAAQFRAALAAAGIAGGIVMSLPPPSFRSLTDERAIGGRYPRSADERLDMLFTWMDGNGTVFPFYWIDPIASGAKREVARAVRRGVKGFKVICNKFYPDDTRAMATFREIAANEKPILFHSGILWDGEPSSGYNRPVRFESLLEIPRLRFALAHISWPWCDECIAVYGKFRHAHAKREEATAEMFIDTTPGTPAIYREEALTKLFTVGYAVTGNVLFGTDCSTASYDSAAAKGILKRDSAIYRKLKLPKEATRNINGNNLLRFIGIDERNR
ncbi:MAG: amidohydrolase family protein [Spirochaetota bacterium]